MSDAIGDGNRGEKLITNRIFEIEQKCSRLVRRARWLLSRDYHRGVQLRFSLVGSLIARRSLDSRGCESVTDSSRTVYERERVARKGGLLSDRIVEVVPRR